MHLDKHRPYGHVMGLPGVVFSQNGHFFDGSGRMVPNPEEGDSIVYSKDQLPEGDIAISPITQSDPGGQNLQPATSAPSISSDFPITKSDDMRLAVNKALKKRMEEDFHEPWQGVEHARKFLGIVE